MILLPLTLFTAMGLLGCLARSKQRPLLAAQRSSFAQRSELWTKMHRLAMRISCCMLQELVPGQPGCHGWLSRLGVNHHNSHRNCQVSAF